MVSDCTISRMASNQEVEKLLIGITVLERAQVKHSTVENYQTAFWLQKIPTVSVLELPVIPQVLIPALLLESQ